MKKSFTFKSVFIGYGLKTGQGVYPGPIYLNTMVLVGLPKIFDHRNQAITSKL